MPEPVATHGETSLPAAPQPPLPKPLTRAERVRALRDKYAWIPFSSDDYAREKRKETEREGR
jgi:hypothetical protein